MSLFQRGPDGGNPNGDYLPAVNYNQLAFWLLFAVVYFAYWRLGHRRQNQLLLAASYVFYGFWDYRFLFLILLSTVIDFIGGLGVAGVRVGRRRGLGLAALLIGAALVLCSHVRYGQLVAAVAAGRPDLAGAALPRTLAEVAIPLATVGACLGYAILLPRLYRARRRRVWFLTISMVANLGLLGFFKYCDFFVSSFAALTSWLGFTVHAPVLGILLPAGISFYTFQAMSYTIDIYRGHARAVDRFGDFALFVAFFPHLVAGPIMRASTLLPQVLTPRTRRPGDLGEGLVLIVVGLFKKLVLADNLAQIANAVFFRLETGQTAGMSGLDVLVGVYAFAFQIYGDFSGYSAIARGISKWLGFELVENFHLPYLAVSPSDFWRRWHISLSSWLRDYLYIPLGGNRRSVFATHRNLLLTMLLGGLWHGARWTFVAWGLFHGLLLIGYRALRVVDRTPAGGVGRWLAQVVVMFHFTCAGWLLFRAPDFATVTRAIALVPHFAPSAVGAGALALLAFYGSVLFVTELLLDGERRVGRLLDAPWPVQAGACAYLTTMILLFQAERPHEFIYFQF